MASTRAATKEDNSPTCHVLNYFYDTDNGFALTALVHTLRFHIMIDYARLENAKVQEEYMALLDELRAQYGDASDQKRRDAESKEGASRKRKRGEADSGYGSSPVDSPSTSKPQTENSVELADDDREDVEGPVRKLQNWVLAPFGDTFAEHAPVEEESKAKTVRDWYHGPVSYWTLACDESGKLSPFKEEPTKPLESRIAELIPSLKMPKYITSAELPLLSTSDLLIEATSDTPSPRHPAVVRAQSNSETYFLKLVDPNQPGPFKRELKLLREIESKDLHKKIRVPLIRGLVIDDASAELQQKTTSEDRACSVLGFLLTAIPDPTPLTAMLDTDVAEDRREKWAKEVERTVKVLHDNDIVWGDAKADNFVVDKSGDLWIIDFGGSHTEGWVDPELNETIEGDDQGTEKIANAVRDPEEFTFDPDEEAEPDEERSQSKRQRTGDGDNAAETKDEDSVNENEEKEDTSAEEKRYCYCNGPDRGQMIGCDGDECQREWFHVECTDLKDVPGEKEKWYCDDCKGKN